MFTSTYFPFTSLHWRHNEHDGMSNHQLRVTGFCVGYSPVAGEFPAYRASNAEKCFIFPTEIHDIVYSLYVVRFWREGGQRSIANRA